MPTLENPRYEAFAQARTKVALLIDACESTGLVRHRGHPSRLAWKSEVAERIAELRALQTDMDDVSPLGLLASLRRIIKAGESSDNPNLVNIARLAILDASRLQAELARAQAADAAIIINDFNHYRTVDFKGEPPEGRPERAPTAPNVARTAPQERPAAAPPTPRGLPKTAPGAPGYRPASATRAPLGLPGLSQPLNAPAPARNPPSHGPPAPPP